LRRMRRGTGNFRIGTGYVRRVCFRFMLRSKPASGSMQQAGGNIVRVACWVAASGIAEAQYGGRTDYHCPRIDKQQKARPSWGT
jgi:hypothetical protein